MMNQETHTHRIHPFISTLSHYKPIRMNICTTLNNEHVIWNLLGMYFLSFIFSWSLQELNSTITNNVYTTQWIKHSWQIGQKSFRGGSKISWRDQDICSMHYTRCKPCSNMSSDTFETLKTIGPVEDSTGTYALSSVFQYFKCVRWFLNDPLVQDKQRLINITGDPSPMQALIPMSVQPMAVILTRRFAQTWFDSSHGN